MITRPLDLASHLQKEPRRFDALFFVNVGLLALFFMLFGSRFVLAPGLAVDFQMKKMPGARAGAATTTHVISVKRAGLIFVDEGALNLVQLRVWLSKQGKTARHPSLLVLASAEVPVADLADIASAAQEAGFERVVWGAEEPGGAKVGGR